MNSYIMNFAVYSFAMTGFLITLLFIYKKASAASVQTGAKNFLKIESMLKLTPSKTVYVITAGNEKFLIAGDPANTTMLAKLDSACLDMHEDIPPEDNMPVNKPAEFLNSGIIGILNKTFSKAFSKAFSKQFQHLIRGRAETPFKNKDLLLQTEQQVQAEILERGA